MTQPTIPAEDGKETAGRRAGTSAIDAVIPWILMLLALLALAGAVIRVTHGGGTVLERVNAETLVFLAVAGALLLLRNVKSFSYGDLKVEFEIVRKEVEEAKSAAQEAKVAASGVDQARELAAEAKTAAEDAKGMAVGIGKTEAAPAADATMAGAPEVDPNDPHKGQFTGRAFDANSYRVLQAEVTPLENASGLFRVHLEVTSTRPETHPLAGVVQFFLHPTFGNAAPIVHVGPSGKAELNLSAWGAFTVGAVADGGTTRLELDLARLQTAPQEFRDR